MNSACWCHAATSRVRLASEVASSLAGGHGQSEAAHATPYKHVSVCFIDLSGFVTWPQQTLPGARRKALHPTANMPVHWPIIKFSTACSRLFRSFILGGSRKASRSACRSDPHTPETLIGPHSFAQCSYTGAQAHTDSRMPVSSRSSCSEGPDCCTPPPLLQLPTGTVRWD